ncbi:hypothetical protein WJX81_006815 [Elliptochloris bilobata]|uniref:PsbP C-terminal domain-containing protein n=1 Tax=Elliptochloris bilobata TaxID=381761 RepID=A0AAW1QLU5_9CHLO
MAGTAQSQGLQWLTQQTVPENNAWPHKLALERRALLLTLLAAACTPAAQAEAADGALVEYVNVKEGYRLLRPTAWEQTSKAGADVLFLGDGTEVGITVSPIRIKSLEQFGTPQFVGDKLLGAERAKESTKSVELLGASERRGAHQVLIYDLDYFVSTTRGEKRVLSTVAVDRNRLYIVNASIKCRRSAAGTCTGEDGGPALARARAVAQSFDTVAA